MFGRQLISIPWIFIRVSLPNVLSFCSSFSSFSSPLSTPIPGWWWSSHLIGLCRSSTCEVEWLPVWNWSNHFLLTRKHGHIHYLVVPFSALPCRAHHQPSTQLLSCWRPSRPRRTTDGLLQTKRSLASCVCNLAVHQFSSSSSSSWAMINCSLSRQQPTADVLHRSICTRKSRQQTSRWA